MSLISEVVRAGRDNNVEELRRLQQQGAAFTETALIYSCENNALAASRFIAKQMSKEDCTTALSVALLPAALSGNLPIIKFIMEYDIEEFELVDALKAVLEQVKNEKCLAVARYFISTRKISNYDDVFPFACSSPEALRFFMQLVPDAVHYAKKYNQNNNLPTWAEAIMRSTAASL